MHKMLMILCLMSISLTAQWPNHPTQGLPRTPDGKADLSAPAPRLANGNPDLSGVWLVKNPGALFYLTQNLKPNEIRPWAAAIYKQRQDNFRNEPTASIVCRRVQKRASGSATYR